MLTAIGYMLLHAPVNITENRYYYLTQSRIARGVGDAAHPYTQDAPAVELRDVLSKHPLDAHTDR